MAERRAPAVLACARVRVELSARLDGEHERALDAALDAHLAWCTACRAHAEELARVRSALRLATAETVPDLTAQIARRVGAEGPRARRRTYWQARLRAASLAAAVAALVLLGASLPWQRSGEAARAAAITERVRAAARALSSYHAVFDIEERGWHPQVPQRRFRAELWFRAPEELRLSLRDLTTYPAAGDWPSNDVDLVVRPGRWWLSEVTSCPTQALPGCGRATIEERSVVNRPPFDDDTRLPTDAILPLETLAESEGVQVLGSGTVAGHSAQRITLPYRQAAPLIASLQPGGSWRPLHPLDRVEVWLERETWFPLRIEVRAAANPERAAWALRHDLGREPAGRLLFRARAIGFDEPRAFAARVFDAPVSGIVRDGRFAPGRAGALPRPGFLAGLSPYRSGRIGSVSVLSYARGLSWLRLTGERGPAVPSLRAEELRLPNGGWAYYLPSGAGLSRRLDLYGDGWHLALESNLPRATLIDIASSIPLQSERAPRVLREGALSVRRLDAAEARALGFVRWPGWLPEGYRARVATLARSNGTRTLTVYFRRAETELDGVGIRLTQAPAAALPPTSERLLAVWVDGVLGRWSPERGELEWVEGGVYRAVAVPSFDVATALRIAEGLG